MDISKITDSLVWYDGIQGIRKDVSDKLQYIVNSIYYEYTQSEAYLKSLAFNLQNTRIGIDGFNEEVNKLYFMQVDITIIYGLMQVFVHLNHKILGLSLKELLERLNSCYNYYLNLYKDVKLEEINFISDVTYLSSEADRFYDSTIWNVLGFPLIINLDDRQMMKSTTDYLVLKPYEFENLIYKYNFSSIQTRGIAFIYERGSDKLYLYKMLQIAKSTYTPFILCYRGKNSDSSLLEDFMKYIRDNINGETIHHIYVYIEHLDDLQQEEFERLKNEYELVNRGIYFLQG